jgi:hypothetical protein
MKQVVLNIPDNKYLDFIKHMRNKFAYIQIKEKKQITNELFEEEGTYDTLPLSEKSLEEDWLTEEDCRWDEVL